MCHKLSLNLQEPPLTMSVKELLIHTDFGFVTKFEDSAIAKI